MLHVIAVELPHLIRLEPWQTPVWVHRDGEILLYTNEKTLVPLDRREVAMSTLAYVIHEGKCEWVDFWIAEGAEVTRDPDGNISVDGQNIAAFSPLDDASGELSYTTLRAFSDFLQVVNRSEEKMVEALKISLRDGFFRNEVEDIIRRDVIRELGELDREIIVRTKVEGFAFVRDYVRELLGSESEGRFIDINYFFRRLFNLEKHRYLYLGAAM